jgi:hypothetical protein
MLKKLSRTIFWAQHFDEMVERHTWYKRIWPHLIPNLSAPNRGHWRQRHDEKVAYWRVEGKRRHLSPLLAAFTALRETAEELYEVYGNEESAQGDFNNMAVRLVDMLKDAAYDDKELLDRYYLSQKWKDRAATVALKRD